MTAIYQCLMTKTGKVGAIANQDSPILNDFVTGWIAGVKFFNDTYGKNIEYTLAYLSDMTITNDYETASVLYGSGHDIVYNIAGFLGLGAAQASEEAGGWQKGIFMIGVDYDQYTVYANRPCRWLHERSHLHGRRSGHRGQRYERHHRRHHRDGQPPLQPGHGWRRLSTTSASSSHSEEVQKELRYRRRSIGEIKVPSYFDFNSYEEFAGFCDDRSFRL